MGAPATAVLTVSAWSRRHTIALWFVVFVLAMMFVLWRQQGTIDDTRAAASTAQAALDANKAATAEARVNSCLQYNDQERKGRAADKAQIRVLTALASPENATAVARLLVNYDHTVDVGHPLRDCTPAGIRQYLESPPSTKGTP